MLNFELKTFNQLSPEQLYDILRLRQEVFIVEQNCPYLDCDGRDLESHHLILLMDNNLAAYCRILKPDLAYKGYASIGRVLTSGDYRGKGLGKKLMVEAMIRVKALFEGVPLKISAQSYLIPFYEELGFIPTGEGYLEDDIPHQAMVLSR